MSDYETKPPERRIRWKLRPEAAKWELTFRVTLPKNDQEKEDKRDEE